ncbi:asparaginyl-tRNA synthetase [Solidesulfovibrio carbinoliphilus subsp. oakridgensis]|uniref:Asparagine--tRNA ligase n=1 Tax=Solidesulfovibrio carbinoliphilus subsp. oakridgensis TaxID=694327 RepID=G7QE01_9BACT|nr:asparagine--tRNA ligase [Solidesulfovibrio carbinoliphilus]EHJ46657.1 asparaginyl-tRNA synthetase [Solidesulfovibrio carbinoliphilus subsp. oakridgensis]
MSIRRTTVKAALESAGACPEIRVMGWVRTRRDAKGFSFLEINDGSCLSNLQVLVEEGIAGADLVKDLGTGAAVDVAGALVASPGKGQRFEVKATALTLLGGADTEAYPLQKKRHSDEFLRTIAHLRPRTNKYGAMLRLRAALGQAVHAFFAERGFYWVHTPIITGSDCEGAGEMFRVTALSAAEAAAEAVLPPAERGSRDFFGKDAYLTVSGQLTAEPLACALGRVYAFGPTFRAEHSDTSRHAAEFWMVEPEMAFADLEDNMELGEGLLKHMVRVAMEDCAEDFGLFAKYVDPKLPETLATLLDAPFVRLPYAEAVKILLAAKKTFEYPVADGRDLQSEHERYLTEEHFKRPVVVYDYPKDIKAFYMRQNDDGRTVAAMDVLVPGIGEIIGGSAREERLDRLSARIREQGLPLEAYGWYLDTRRFGTVPHVGFGLGFERVLMLVTGIGNIRDVMAFPRTWRHLEF